MSERSLVIAPHPDDEVLGVGGTMARLADEGSEVYVLVVTKGGPPLFDEELVKSGRREAVSAHRLLGVKDTICLSFPACGLDMVAQSELNGQLDQILRDLRPEALYVPFNGDIHIDHQRVFTAALVASRPKNLWAPSAIYAYETLSETNWNAPYLTPSFAANRFIDISAYLERKLEAMQMYASQLKLFPHERSIEALRALALHRGSTIGRLAAEAFVVIRQVV
jgi:N-acetylglucosamine malate deacetylase 1